MKYIYTLLICYILVHEHVTSYCDIINPFLCSRCKTSPVWKTSHCARFSRRGYAAQKSKRDVIITPSARLMAYWETVAFLLLTRWQYLSLTLSHSVNRRLLLSRCRGLVRSCGVVVKQWNQASQVPSHGVVIVDAYVNLLQWNSQWNGTELEPSHWLQNIVHNFDVFY